MVLVDYGGVGSVPLFVCGDVDHGAQVQRAARTAQSERVAGLPTRDDADAEFSERRVDLNPSTNIPSEIAMQFHGGILRCD